MSNPNPTSGTSADTEGLIRVFITPTMLRELHRRNMFPELRLHNARSICGAGTGVYIVSPARAREILADAKAMRQKAAEIPRGVAKSYTALIDRLTEALRAEARRGCWNAPSIEEMKQRLNESPARFEVGDGCLYFRDDDQQYGTSVKIVGGLNLYRVSYEDGHFINEHGRCEYQMGYVVQEEGHEPYFVRPFQLTRDDCKPSHLRLVAGLDVQQAQRHA